jgi:hypothetical protein
MAKIGVLYPRYCPLTITETGGVVTETLGTGKVFGRAIKISTTINTSSGKQYSDDDVGESLKEFVSGTLSAEVDDVADTVSAEIHGETTDTESSDIVSGMDTVAPYLRFGYIRRGIKNGVLKYSGIVLMKVQFNIPSEEDETKTENISYKGTTETADIMLNKDRVWKRRKTFTTLDAALAYVNGLVNISSGT